MLMYGNREIVRVSYDFDGFRRPSLEVVGTGEITFPLNSLKDVFGLDVQVRTDDGRILKLKFSEKTLGPEANVAHVDVSGDLPRFDQHWRRWDH